MSDPIEHAPEGAAHPPESDRIDPVESDDSGGFREPHPEEPGDTAEFHGAHEGADAPEDADEAHEAHEPPEASEDREGQEESGQRPERPLRAENRQEMRREARPDRRERQERPERSEPRPESRPEARPEPRQEQRPKPWVKPADFRQADSSAIAQAVEHATQIAADLKQMMDDIEGILELVEVAERQKIADEREIEELRRALRRVQPQRLQTSAQAPRNPRPDDQSRGPRDQGGRREDSRRSPDRQDRPDRQPRADRPDRQDRQDRPPERLERPERPAPSAPYSPEPEPAPAPAPEPPPEAPAQGA